jgi:hypothetical protein
MNLFKVWRCSKKFFEINFATSALSQREREMEEETQRKASERREREARVREEREGPHGRSVQHVLYSVQCVFCRE